MAQPINIHDAKTQLSRLVEEAAAGKEIIIAKAGRPMARLVPLVSAPKPKKLGLLKGALDIAADFDAPLAIDFLIAGKV
ncbi:MAG: type II toxin-antitoxin system Phd/YefM family antitoxin [Betaproteobacteria bacterium]|nr:type II toxin-antitoxin system Phd/YefM family antitoxin [Betaproteobacteria bacterium]